MITYLATEVGHLYPFKSGCGSFANSRVFRYLDPDGGLDSCVNVCGGRALIPGGDYVGRAMRFVGDLDRKISWVIDRVVKPGDTALDIGSNLGLVSLRLAARVGANGHVHAFDPQPRMQKYFRETLKLNPKLAITLHEHALGRDASTLTLRIPNGNAGAASLVHDKKRVADATGEEISVKVLSLSDYANEIGLGRIDFIKMDVEGFEAEVIAGATDILEQTRPKAIILEENRGVSGATLPPSLIALQSLGYDLFALPKRLLSVRLVPVSNSTDAHDYVAVSRDAPDWVRSGLGV